MSDTSERTFGADFKRFFLRGLVVLLPSVLTLWICVKAYQFIDNTIAEPINRGVRVAMINSARVWSPLREAFDPTEEALSAEMAIVQAAGNDVARPEVRSRMRAANIQQWWRDHVFMDLIGLLVAIISVYIAGRLLGGFVGRRIYRRLEGFFTSLPVVKQVYPYVKQIVDFLFSDEQPIKFNRVVAIEYPRKGIWSVGFLTGKTMRSIQAQSGDSVTIFIPSSPTPFTGYTITVPREEIIELPITVEEAIRFAVSGGVLVPGHQVIDERFEASKSADEILPSGLVPIPGSSPDAPSPPAGSPAEPETDADQPPRSRAG